MKRNEPKTEEAPIDFGYFKIDPEEDKKKLERAKRSTIVLIVLMAIMIACCVIFIPHILDPLAEMEDASDTSMGVENE